MHALSSLLVISDEHYSGLWFRLWVNHDEDSENTFIEEAAQPPWTCFLLFSSVMPVL